MPSLDLKRLAAWQARTFRLQPGKRLTTPAQAQKFVDERGFVFFWPVKGMTLPSLWTAVAGDRPGADEHDDPGHVTWGWKDNALDKRVWYYGKILRRKGTFISLEIAPYFYALSENYGDIEQDHIIPYEAGRLTMAARIIYETLLKKGKLNTIDLRKEAHLTSKSSDAEFNRALDDLQKDFKVLPVGVAEAGAWHYSYQYDLTARHFPDLPEQARRIGEAEARRKLVELYFNSVGAAQLRDVTRLFGWQAELARRAVGRLVEAGVLADGLDHPQVKGEWVALPELVG